MKKIIRLTESDLTRIVKRVINETNTDLYNMAIQRVKKNPSGSMKAIQLYKPKTQEEENDKNFYITFIQSVIDKSPMTPADYIGKRLSYNMELFNLIPTLKL
jgi:hypothetical protein